MFSALLSIVMRGNPVCMEAVANDAYSSHLESVKTFTLPTADQCIDFGLTFFGPMITRASLMEGDQLMSSPPF